MKKVDEPVVMERLFCFLKDFPEFENLKEIRYDSENRFVRIRIGIGEKIIPITDDTMWLGIVREVISELEKEKLWNAYLDTMNGKPHRPNPSRSLDVIVAGANCGRGIGYSRLTEKNSARIV